MLVLSLACTLAAHGYYLMQLPPIHSLSAVSNVATCWSVSLSMHLPPVLWAWLRAPSPWLYWTQSPPGGKIGTIHICLFLFMDIALGCVVRYWKQPPPGGKNRLIFFCRADPYYTVIFYSSSQRKFEEEIVPWIMRLPAYIAVGCALHNYDIENNFL